ncbi:GGDEF domain-containing protein [Mycolicibacterium komossense]|uniref:GGDEF domain-containing protein n=1 Tax=Mycolicibacterium komossense TaxID=1779 RepID=A0ABT3CB39_9MYCO|nr:GGDEF domain-containing protein [Mycolicibacterium komossense]MCV7226647.1 GGDEF domain-containing protein [Mycolicibacterium komossense]
MSRLRRAWAPVLGSIRFDGPLEAEYRVYFDRIGRSARSEMWLIMLVVITIVLICNRVLLDVPPDVLPLGRFLVIGVLVPMVLRWFSGDRSPLRRWSSALFIASVYIDIGAMMALRVACLDNGIDIVPLVMPIAVLMSLIVVQIRFVVLAPAILLGLVGLVGVELLVLDTDSNGLFDIAAAAAMVTVALPAAYDLERWTRLGWLRQRELDLLTKTDPLTGLANRRHFNEILRTTVESTRQRDGAFALMILDVDYFKTYNDKYGHPAGDGCLAVVAEHLTMATGTDGFVARLGGEEFAVLWFDGATAATRGEQLRHGLANITLEPLPGVPTTITASAGLACMAPGDSDIDSVVSDLFARADTALYEAKRAGRDSLIVFAGQELRGSRDRYDDPTERQPSTAGEFELPRSLRFAPGPESKFQAVFAAEGRSARRLIMIGLLVVIALLLMFQTPLLKIPPEADRLGRLTLIFGLTPGALLALVGNTWTRLNRWSPQLYIAGVAVILSAQMAERVVQLPKGYDVVPLIMPLSVLLSLTVVQIPFTMLAPAALAGLTGIVAVELTAFPITGNRLLAVSACIVMVSVTLRFAYKLERSRRISWLVDQRLDRLAREDPLTGLLNRRQFDQSLNDLLRSAVQADRQVAFAILDIDSFKDYNDGLGHLAGDECLRVVGQYLTEMAAAVGGIAARLGGEEFAIVWIDTSGDGSERAEQIRQGVPQLGIRPAPGSRAVTVSAGIVVTPAHRDPVELADVLHRQADAALYAAKDAGRDLAVITHLQPSE